jgi:hypothetical protein
MRILTIWQNFKSALVHGKSAKNMLRRVARCKQLRAPSPSNPQPTGAQVGFSLIDFFSLVTARLPVKGFETVGMVFECGSGHVGNTEICTASSCNSMSASLSRTAPLTHQFAHHNCSLIAGACEQKLAARRLQAVCSSTSCSLSLQCASLLCRTWKGTNVIGVCDTHRRAS